jgi:hypothetical protein
MTIRYWYKNCPRCGPEGELFISKRRESGTLCFQCAECFWACDDPASIDDYWKGYEGDEDDFEAPTREEIERAGWGKYCLEEEDEEGRRELDQG